MGVSCDVARNLPSPYSLDGDENGELDARVGVRGPFQERQGGAKRRAHNHTYPYMMMTDDDDDDDDDDADDDGDRRWITISMNEQKVCWDGYDRYDNDKDEGRGSKPCMPLPNLRLETCLLHMQCGGHTPNPYDLADAVQHHWRSS